MQATYQMRLWIRIIYFLTSAYELLTVAPQQVLSPDMLLTACNATPQSKATAPNLPEYVQLM